MPPVYKKLKTLSGKSPICFSGTKIPESVADIITSDGEKSLKAKFHKGQKIRTVTEGNLLFIQGTPLDNGKNKPEQLRQFGASVWEELSRQRLKDVETAGEGSSGGSGTYTL